MKAYMIVTNDKYEFPVAFDIFGKKAAAEYLGIEMGCFESCMHRNSWSKKHKYKAVVDEYGTLILQNDLKREAKRKRKIYERNLYLRKVGRKDVLKA